MRRTILAQPMLGIVQTVFRGSVQKGKKGQKKVGNPKIFCLEIPSPCCVQLHVVLLDPVQDARFKATCLSPVLQVDPHSDHVLAQVPAQNFQVREREDAILVDVSPLTLEAIREIKTAKLIMSSSVLRRIAGG